MTDPAINPAFFPDEPPELTSGTLAPIVSFKQFKKVMLSPDGRGVLAIAV